MPSISFDRAATFYDATRGYGPGVAERVRDAIVAYTGASSSSRFLELGVGTGRIALPFIQAGYSYTGIDISDAMMDRLREKLANDPAASTYNYELRQADATRLPFDDNSFDVVIAFHVLHLVGDRLQTLREVKRVLRPGGVFLSAYDGAPEDEQEDTPPRMVRLKWLEIMQDLQGTTSAQEISHWITDEMVVADLEQLGATTEIVHLSPYERPEISPRGMADLIEARAYSSDWTTPDKLHAEATLRLEAWLREAFPDSNTPYQIAGDVVAVVGRWR
jgi:ubiquinone/menaquinone biosynthesis C-methylase UbiE